MKKRAYVKVTGFVRLDAAPLAAARVDAGVAPVIHPAARGGPECRAGLGGSIKWAAVLCERGQTFNASSPEQRKKVSGARGAFKWSAGAHRAALTGRALAGPGAWRQRISPSRSP